MDSGLGDEIRRKIEALRLGLGGDGDWGGGGGGGGDGGGRMQEPVAEQDDSPEGLAGAVSGVAVDIDLVPGARQVASDHGKCLMIERPIEDCAGTEAAEAARILEAYRALARRLDEAGIGPVRGSAVRGSQARAGRVRGDQPRREWPGLAGAGCRLAFLDLETTGLSATPLFLAGALLVGEGRVRALQMLARDYSEERCLIAALDEALKDHDVCITFNGKSFDLPYLRERAKYHRLTLQASPRQLDLLHHARRRWKRSLPNCRLLTLEWYILGRRRIGDVDGWEVPCIYHEFVHTKDARRLQHVLRHNLMDVFSMAQLLISLAEA